MAHIGMVCTPFSGHLHPTAAIGRTLIERGHRVSFVGFEDCRAKITASGLDFVPVGQEQVPLGTAREFERLLGCTTDHASVRLTLEMLGKRITTFFEEGPSIFRELDLDLVVVDQMSFEAGIVAEYLGIPFVSLANAMLFNREPSLPPVIFGWDYRPTWYTGVRNRLANWFLDYLKLPLRRIVRRQRRAWNLRVLPSNDAIHSPYAQLSQQVQELEFPRKYLPAWFHFLGPFQHPASRKPVDFPYEQLNGKPLIYASLGTIQNQLDTIYATIAAACEDVDAQLVISLGGGEVHFSQPLAGNPLVVPYAPQLELLQRAALTITHAGMNTTMESLAAGVPMVAIPIANDQPAIAARIAWSGCGERLPLQELDPAKLKALVQKVLHDPGYRQRALAIQQSIHQAGGAVRACEIIEQVHQTKQPVLAQHSPPAVPA